jgi:cytochrome P450
MLARHVLSDVELHGKVMPAGSKAVLVLGSANRDDRVFPDPDRFDISRDKGDVSQLLSFGVGKHFCLGANLARLEAQIALRELVRRVKTVEVDHDACRRVHSINVRGFASVPVRVGLR